MTDQINNPSHYVGNALRLEPIVFAERLSFNWGNVLKYVWRAGSKPGASRLTDLKKALWYAERAMDNDNDSLDDEFLELLTYHPNELVQAFAFSEFDVLEAIQSEIEELENDSQS